MKSRLLIIGLLVVTTILGSMFYVDMYHCASDFYPPGLYFAVCSETFGFRIITTEIINSVYYLDHSRNETMIIPLCKDVNWLYNGKCLEPKPGSDQTITKIPFHNDLQEIIIDSSQEKRKPLDLQRVLDSCNSTGIQPSMGYGYSNDTHIITNNSCEWQTLLENEKDILSSNKDLLKNLF